MQIICLAVKETSIFKKIKSLYKDDVLIKSNLDEIIAEERINNKEIILITEFPVCIATRIAYSIKIINLINIIGDQVIVIKGDCHEFATKLSKKTGLKIVNDSTERELYIPQIIPDNKIVADNEDDLVVVNEHLRNGDVIEIITDLNVNIKNSLLNDGCFQIKKISGYNTYDKLYEEYVKAKEERVVKVFVTYRNLREEFEKSGITSNFKGVLQLVPVNLVLGVAQKLHSDDDYVLNEFIRKMRLFKYNIKGVKVIAASGFASQSQFIHSLVSEFDAKLVRFDARNILLQKSSANQTSKLVSSYYPDPETLIGECNIDNEISFTLAAPSLASSICEIPVVVG